MPRLPDGLVCRLAPIQTLRRGLSSRLTLVSAPAGYGKTTLVAAGLSGLAAHCGWLSLDPSDNDPVQFWRYVDVAIAGSGAIAAQRILDRRTNSPHFSADTLVSKLVNEMAQRAEPQLLVLEDYHVIEATSVHKSLERFVDHLPSQAHVIVISRVDPPLPLARLRAHGELNEIRVGDLRFSTDEADLLLNRAMGLSLDAAQIASLVERTEGWAAGLRLAGLSLKGHQDRESFVASFGATHSYVLDYLTEEVLTRQDGELESFLSQTSILDRLCAPLCDVVTGRTDSQEMLRRAENANLFMVRLDDERRWYRFHRLFADLLRQRLRDRDPEEAIALHKRASLWFEQEGDLEEAARHALAAGDDRRVAALLEQVLITLVTTGRTATARMWMDALSAEMLDKHPLLAVWGSWASFLRGDVREARRLIVLAGSDPKADGAVVTIRAFLSRAVGNLTRSLEESETALARLPVEMPLLRGMATFNLAVLHTFGGDIDIARRLSEEALALARHSRPFWDDGVISNLLARVALQSGRLLEAEEICSATIEEGLGSSGTAPVPVLAHVYVTLGDVRLEFDQLPEAQKCFDRALTICEPTGEPAAAFGARLGMSRIAFAQGDIHGSREALKHAGAALPVNLAPWIRPYLESWAARLASAEGNHAVALNHATHAEEACVHGGQFAVLHYPTFLNVARVRLAAGCPADRAQRLRDMAERAEREGRTGMLIEILTVGAEILDAEGHEKDAATELKRALALADPRGYARTFLDDGEPVARLLRVIASQGHGGAYLGRLADAFTSSGPLQSSRRPMAGRAATARRQRRRDLGLPTDPEPLLSERELEVVRLLAQGKSNKEIASQLYLAEGTVKKHVYNICMKLGAARRSHAVARARELGLL
ncbi:MAG: LuxR C-terminal-related transcriptional regulator [Thermoleophilia bacterium]